MAKENDAGSWLIRIQTKWKNEGMDKFVSSIGSLRQTLNNATDTFMSTSGEAAELYRDAKYIGTSVTQIERYAVALRLMGGNAGEAKDQILGLSEAYNRIKMGDLSAEDYARLGLSNEDMQDYDKFFAALRRRFKDSQDYGFFRELAGRVGIGRDMMNLLSSPDKEYNDVMGFANKHILVDDKEAKRFQEFEKTISKFKVSWSQLKKEFMVAISPSLNDFFGKLEKVFEDPKVIEGVKHLGDEMADLVKDLTTGDNAKEFFISLNEFLAQLLDMAKNSKPIFELLRALGSFVLRVGEVAGTGAGKLVGALESEGTIIDSPKLAKIDSMSPVMGNPKLADIDPLSRKNTNRITDAMGLPSLLPTPDIKIYIAGDLSSLAQKVDVQIQSKLKQSRANILRKDAKEKII